MFNPNYAKIGCIMIWVLAFLIISPTTFGAYGFGTFGFDPQHGMCEIKQQLETDAVISPTGWYFLGGCTIPCIIIIAGYIVLSLYIREHSKRVSTVLTSNMSQVRKPYSKLTK